MDSLRVDLGRQGSSSGGGLGASSGGSRSFANSRTTSHAPSPTLHSQHRDLPQRPFSPASSDAGSATSSTVQGDTSRRESLNGSMSSSRRLGSLQGAGLSSLSLALGADAGYTAGSSLVGFNAISTILNNPNKPQRPIDPSSSRYPPISQSHTELPKVKRSDFDATLQGIRAEWDRYQRNQKLGVRGRARLEAEDEEGRGERSEGEARRSGALDDDDEETTARALGKKRLPPLSTVPQVFFSEDFDLGNPYTFDLVTERYKAASSSGASSSGPASNSRNGAMMPGYDVALNQMLQEKLSYYSDVVEQHLILEISARSSSFFAALGNLKDLEAESKNCLDKVEELKRELDDRDEGIAKAGLRLVREQAKQRETKERLEAVGLMHQLCEKRDLCQLLVQNNEWSEALDVMQNLADLITGKAKLTPRQHAQQAILPPHVDLELASIPAVQAMSPQLHEMRNNIAAQLEVEVLSILMNDIEERVKGAHVPSRVDPATPVVAQAPDATSDVAEASPPPAASNTDARASLNDGEARLADRLSAHIKGLVRTEGIDRAMAAYKEAMLKVPRTTMRTCLETALGDGEVWLTDLAALLEDDEAAQGKSDAKLGPGGAEAASKLQVLPFERFIALLHSLLKGLTGCVQAVDAQRRVLVKLLDDEGRRQEETSDAPEEKVGLLMPAGVSHSLPTTLAGIVTDVCSTSHVLASRLLSLRSTTHTGLPLPQFLAVFRLAWSFILESEALCGRMIIGLRGVVLNQAKSWLAYFHKTHIEKAAKAVEEEQWGQAEVSAKQQSDIATIIDSATSDPPALLASGQGEASPSSPDDARRKTLSIEEKQYFVVGASLDVLDMLVDYLRVVLSLPLLGTEIMGRIVEFLKQFNSRTCQVVLGAGAMRSAGLKNITAKHLALASQSLSIMITLIPYVRESVRRHLNPRQAVMLIEFDKLKRDYQEHQYEIHSKLVAIMSDRLTVHCRALANTDWSATIAEQDADISAAALAPKPMLDLVKETTTLHKVLCKYLQPSVVELVIGQVLLSIDTRIAAELRKVETHDENSLKRAESVVEHFNDKFGALKHVEWTAKELNAALQEQESEQDKAPPTPKKSVEEARPLSPIVTAPSPAPASPTHTPTSPSPAPTELPPTPTYTPRLSMTLQQRLAAAARRRAQSSPFSRPAATASAKVDEQAETAGGVKEANGSEKEDEQVPAAIAKDLVEQGVTDSAKEEEESAAKTYSANGVEPVNSANEKEEQPVLGSSAQDELRPASTGGNEGEQADAAGAAEEEGPTAGRDATQAEQPASATAAQVEEAETTSAETEQQPAAPADASTVEPEVTSVSAKEEEPAATAIVVDEDKEAAAISVTEERQQPTAIISASNAGEEALATTGNANKKDADAPTANEDGEPVESSVPPSEDDRTATASVKDEEQPELAVSANGEGQAGDIPAEGGAKSAKKGKKKKKGKK